MTPFTPTPDDDEATEGGRITKLAQGGIPHDVSAKLVAIPTGKAAASRTITWDGNAVTVVRNGVEISGGLVVLPEDQGRVELEVYAKTGFSLGQTSTVTMTALSSGGEPIGEIDSVALTYVLYNFDITHRVSSSMPSDDAFEEELNGSNQLVVTPKVPETTILIEFQREWRDSTGANVEMRAVEDGSIAAVEVLEGNDFVQSIPDQVTFANGIAFVPVKFNGIAGGPVVLRIKPQKAIYNNGSSHDDFEDGVSASLSPKTGGIEILPGRPWGSSTVANSPGLNLGVQVTAKLAGGINLDSLILDGATLITYHATFKDHFGNQVLDGLPVDWDYVSQAETIQVDSVTNGGTAKYVAKSPDRRDCEGPAQHNLYAGCLGESNNHVMGFSELNPKGAFKQYTMATASENIPAEFPGAFVRPADENTDNLKFVHSGMILYADDRLEAIEFEAAFASDAIPIARNTRIRWQAENLGLVRKDETITLGYDPKDGYARAVARPNLSVPGPFRLVAQIGNATVEFRGTVVFRPGVAKIYPAPPSVGEYPQDRIISSDSSGNTVYDFDGPDIGNLEKIPIPVFASVIMVVDALPQFAGAKVRPYVSGISSSAFQIIPLSAHSGADIILDANGDGRFLVKSTGSTSIEGRFQIGARVTSVPSGGQFSFIPTSLVTATSERIGKIKGVVIGAIAGASYTDPSFGAIAADLATSFCLVGDLRDCSVEGVKFLIPGVCVDRFTLAFASLGLLTNLEPIADTSVAAIKVSGKIFGRTGKSSKTFFSVARRLVDNSNLGRPVFDGMESILEFTGTMQRAFPPN